MWIHNLDPVLVQFGSLQIRWYGLVYVFGALLSYWYLERARKTGTLKLTEKDTSDLITWLIIGVLIGSRLFAVLVYNLPYYLSQPWWKVFAVWEGGMSFHGGLVGIVIVGWMFCRRKMIPVLQIGDILSVPLMLALALGRIANFMNGELWGTPTDAGWCVIFPAADALCRHPYVLYDGVKRFFIFFWLLFISKKSFSSGFIFWNFVFLESIGRFALDFVKEDIIYVHLGAGQWLSIFAVVVSGYFLFWKHMNDLNVLRHGA